MRVHNKKNGVIAEMNMIPLIDISLILLIIFMVITPFLVQSQIQVSLPKAETGTKGADEGVLKVQLGADGSLALDGRPLRFQRLEKELILRFSKAYKKTLLVEADKSVAVERVVAVLDLAKKLGAGKIGIAVKPDDGK
ncbi:MAG TPA: biopolymer transporter ExbD [Elusimicrobiales bacterium]|nr:biopolymer transporter ExbD [Elusimicrobiales bacterium]